MVLDREGGKEDWVGRVPDYKTVLRNVHPGQWAVFMPVGRVLYLLRKEWALFIYELKADHRKPGLSMNTMVDPQG